MHDFFRLAPITAGVILVNVVIFVAYHLGLLPLAWMLATPGEIGIQTFVAHLSHVDLLHIAMNMVIFSQVGPILERQLGGALYLSALMGILLLTALLGQPFLDAYTLGFSGVLMGLLVLGAGVMSHYRSFSQQLLVLVAVNLVTGLLPGISFLMHFTGAVAGGLIFLGLRQMRA
jgi:membrane associated rhomboid family serine protease